MPEQPILNIAEQRNLAAEAVAKGAEKAAAAASLSAGQKEVAHAAAKNLSAEGGRSALSTLGTEFKHGAEAASIIDKIIPSKMEVDGKLSAQGDETARMEALKKQVVALEKVLLNPRDSTIVAADMDVVIAQIAVVLARDPVIAKAYEVPPGNQALIKGALASAEGRAAVAKALNAAFGGSRETLARISQLDTQGRTAQAELAKKQKEYDRLKKQRDALGSATTDLTTFQTTTDVNVDGTSMTGKDAMANIGGQLAASGADVGVVNFAKNIDDLNAKQAEYRVTPTPALAAEVAKIQGWIDKAKLDTGWGAKCTQYEQVRNRLQGINERIVRGGKMADVDNLDDRLTDAEVALNMAKRAVEDISFERRLEVSVFESGVQYAAGTGIAEAIDKRMQDFMDAYPKYEGEAKTALEQKARDLLGEAIKNRYFKLQTQKLGGLERFFHGSKSSTVIESVYNTAQAEKDIINALSSPNAPAELVREILETNTPTIGNLTPEQAAILVKDPKFVNEQMRNIMMKAIPTYARSNGMSPQVLDGLVRGTEWGAAAIDEFIRQNNEASDAVSRYEASGGYISRGVLKQMGPGWLLKLLMYLGLMGMSPFVQDTSRNP